MQKIKGRYTEARIFADVVEQAALDQIQTLCDQPFAEGSSIAVMPDVHAGAGCTIGTTMTIDPLHGKVCPNLVGVDIGCGMLVTELGRTDIDSIDFAELDATIRRLVPAGQNAHPVNIPTGYPEWEDKMLSKARHEVDRFLCELNTPINFDYELARLGTLGGGNHFIEVDEDEEGNRYLVIHSGSRHLGVQVCSHFMDVANANRLGSRERHEQEKKDLIANMRAAGRARDIAATLIEFNKRFTPTAPSPLAYVEKDDLAYYLNDMKIAQWFAQENRFLMSDIICIAMGWNPVARWETVHNYIDMDEGILRKGAISLRLGEKALIPISMKDGALIVSGKGNPDYNFSGPHGAGRLMGRSEAKSSLSMDEYRKEMEGVWTSSVSEDTLDESPMAYKRIDDILPSLEPTADVLKHIVPVYSFKASD